jgi:hypothetical protein
MCQASLHHGNWGSSNWLQNDDTFVTAIAVRAKLSISEQESCVFYQLSWKIGRVTCYFSSTIKSFLPQFWLFSSEDADRDMSFWKKKDEDLVSWLMGFKESKHID